MIKHLITSQLKYKFGVVSVLGLFEHLRWHLRWWQHEGYLRWCHEERCHLWWQHEGYLRWCYLSYLRAIWDYDVVRALSLVTAPKMRHLVSKMQMFNRLDPGQINKPNFSLRFISNNFIQWNRSKTYLCGGIHSADPVYIYVYIYIYIYLL